MTTTTNTENPVARLTCCCCGNSTTDVFYRGRPYAHSRRIKNEGTTQKEPAIVARCYSPDAALIQVWTKEGQQSIRYSGATLNRQECLDLSDVLRKIAGQLNKPASENDVRDCFEAIYPTATKV